MTKLATYDDCLRYLLGLTGRGIQPGLGRMRRALTLLGHPERRYPAVLVGGTNGKGSVAAMVAGAAGRQGLRVGLFTSPHLHRLTERIRVRGREVGHRQLASSLRHVVASLEGGPRLTFFETVTAVAAHVFAAEAVDLAVFEVGLGGRLDATRLVVAKVVVLTSIAMDHERLLGRSLGAIAEEKLALVRRGAVTVAGPVRRDIRTRLVQAAHGRRSPLLLHGRDFTATRRSGGRMDFEGPGGALPGLRLPLEGAHQAVNAAVAVAAARALSRSGLEVGDEAIRRGLAATRWPGRFELVAGGRAVLDVAHNPAGARALRDRLTELDLEGRRVVLVLGAMRDKNVAGIAAPLLGLADEVLLAAPRLDRALHPEAFPPSVRGRPMPSVEAAADEALERAGPNGLVVITGSSFVVAEARAHLLGLRAVDPSIPM